MQQRYGSDVVVDGLDQLGITFLASHPGASFRGLHDSVTISSTVSLVETLNESIAVSIAHGYAKSSNSLMGVALHDLVGLQAASMAVYNAWVDMVPILLLGGSGPANHPDRRPWIDWIHTAKPQSLAVRDFVKWDDQPTSVSAIPESLARAYYLATLAPAGPTYVALDVSIQDEPVDGQKTLIPLPSSRSRISGDLGVIEEVAQAISDATRPVLVADYAGRSANSFRLLQEVARLISAPVIDLGSSLNLPTSHANDATLVKHEVLKWADLILAFEVRDLAWAGIGTGSNPGIAQPGAKVVSVGLNDLMKSSFVDLERFGYVDIRIVAETEVVLEELSKLLQNTQPELETREWLDKIRARQRAEKRRTPPRGDMTVEHIIADSAERLRGIPVQVSHLGPGSASKYAWLRHYWKLDEFGSFLGRSGGGGIGYGVGASVGAGLAQRDTGRIVVDFQTDGDALHSIAGLWTAAHHKVPTLFIVLNNRGYERERLHQREIAQRRSRSTDRSSIGTDITDPDISFTMLAEGQGVASFGPALSRDSFQDCLSAAVELVADQRLPALVEVVIG